MDRRETLKTLFVGTVGSATLVTVGCKTDTPEKPAETSDAPLYGRTPKELEHDKAIQAQTFFHADEMATIAVLCDIILPATSTAGSATDAQVPEFVEFIVKDLPTHQLPFRGGLMWLNSESQRRFGKDFREASDSEQIQLIDDIAYPDPDNKKPEMAPGIKFFNQIRNLTLTGYYTTRMGLNDLGYQGNTPNVWDGVPEEVLKEHDVAYDPEWIAKCVDQSKRDVQAEWDEEGNLLT